MPITRAQADTILLAYAAPLLTQVGLDGTTVGGNVATTDPLREGLASLSLLPASFGAVTDADLAQVADKDVSQLIDVAKLWLLDAVMGSFTDVDETISMGSVRVGQFGDRVAARMATLADFVRRKYGYGLGTLKAGGILTARPYCRPCTPPPGEM